MKCVVERYDVLALKKKNISLDLRFQIKIQDAEKDSFFEAQ